MKLEWIVAFIYVVIATTLVTIRPSVGLADNRDFRRFMVQLHLDYPPDTPNRYYGTAHFQFIRTNAPLAEYLNPLTYVALSAPFHVASLLNHCFSPPSDFDVRWAGFVLILMLGAGVLLWVRATRGKTRWQRGVYSAFILLLFADLGYLEYVNTFYAEATSLAYLLLALGCLMNVWVGDETARPGIASRLAWIGVFFLFALLFCGCKAQDAPLIVPLALLGIFAGAQSRRPRAWLAVLGMTLIVIPLAALSLGHYEKTALRLNEYNSVFGCLLQHSPSPATDLKELGLPPALARFAGTDAWASNAGVADPLVEQTFYPRITPARIAGFYLRHPSRLYAALDVASRQMVDIRPTYLGNFDAQSGIKAFRVGEILTPGELPAGQRWKWFEWMLFSLSSGLKDAAIPARPWFWIAFGMINLIAGLFHARRSHPRARLTGGVRACIAVIYLLVPIIVVIGDGECELRKHLFLAGATFDLLLLFLLNDLTHWLSSRQRGHAMPAAQRVG